MKARSEEELVEGYNRRDNLKIIGIPENRGLDTNGRQIIEDNNESIARVIKVATNIDAKVTEGGISIAHRLPTRKKTNSNKDCAFFKESRKSEHAKEQEITHAIYSNERY